MLLLVFVVRVEVAPNEDEDKENALVGWTDTEDIAARSNKKCNTGFIAVVVIVVISCRCLV